MTIFTRGNPFVHILDGLVISVAVDEDAKNLRKSSLPGLQVHQGPLMKLDQKNFRIRDAEVSSATALRGGTALSIPPCPV